MTFEQIAAWAPLDAKFAFVVMVIEEKCQYWHERIDAAAQGAKTLFGWVLE